MEKYLSADFFLLALFLPLHSSRFYKSLPLLFGLRGDKKTLPTLFSGLR